MGIPKFFRYISERYPCLNEAIKEHQIPEFDNLYLDMNGIFHVSSHPNDQDPHFRISEEEIYKNIFHYLEVLFSLIQPKKLFFMAVDGVAPRAKMNQQRERRFMSAKEAELLEKKALAKGEVLPEGERFDSNCITPGTEFMAKLDKQLRYFISHKISTDKIWQKPTIIYSGHETPGEGEHKIMDYIRYLRSQEGWDPATRHCLYGLDADLIMLGLCTHEPHFALLREEVKFGRKNQKRIKTPEETRFFLFHLSMLRGYLDLEFQDLKTSLSFEFDIERLIDDWILMVFLLGNDFIPDLPGLSIAEGALHLLCRTYVQVLPTLNGYINESGSLNLERFEAFMRKLAEYDFDQFRENQADMRYFESKTGRKMMLAGNEAEDDDGKDEVDNVNFRSTSMNDELQCLIESTKHELENGTSGEASEEEDDDTSKEDEEDQDDDELMRAEFCQFKKDYYMNKLQYRQVTPEVLRSQAEGYVRAIQWNLHYYYNGCPSWSWFYPHHYSPYISDIRGFSNLKLDFELSRPFLPFQQLLAVLPSASKDLLPKALQKLMTSEDSPLINFYPKEFALDLNGKKQDWEAIALIPFIDQDSLLKAMEPCYAAFTDEEKKRNVHSPMLIYKFTPEDIGVLEAPQYFPRIEHNHAKTTEVSAEELAVDRELLVKGRYPGYEQSYCRGFPTLDRIPFTARLLKEKVRVFEQPSRSENMILTLKNDDTRPTLEIAQELLGKILFVNWPHLAQALVTHIASSEDCYTLNAEDKVAVKTGCCRSNWSTMKSAIVTRYKSNLGIELGPMRAIVCARLMDGERLIFQNGAASTEIVWNSNVENYPLQTTVTSIEPERGDVPKTLEEIFPVGGHCFLLGDPYYGSQGKILESNMDGRVKIQVMVKPEPNVGVISAISAKYKKTYMSGGQAAHKVCMSPHLWSRITGTIYIVQDPNSDSRKVNIGLNLKFSKKNEALLGFTRKENNQWYYSEKAVEIVRQYMEKFPDLFLYLGKNAGDDIFCISEVFPENPTERVKEVSSWLKEQPHYTAERRSVGVTSIEEEAVAQLETLVANFKTRTVREVTMHVKPHLVYLPKTYLGLNPDPKVRHYLLDRVVSIRECHTIPLGLRGTIIAIEKKKNEGESLYDILFDESFPGGLNLGSRDSRCYRLTGHGFINLSYSLADDNSHSSGATSAAASRPHNNTSQYRANMPLVQSNDTDKNSRNNSAFANWRNREQQQKQPDSHDLPGSTSALAFLKAFENYSRQGDGSNGGSTKQQATPPAPAAPPTPQAVLQPHLQKPTADTEFQAMWNILQNQKLEPKIPPKAHAGGSGGGGGGGGGGGATSSQSEPLAAAVSQQTDALKKFLKLDTSAPTSLRPDIPTMQPKPVKPCGHISCCSHLITVCQKLGIAYPVYSYGRNIMTNTMTCTIRFPGILREFLGQPDKEKVVAAESAACNAIQSLLQQEPKFQLQQSRLNILQHHQHNLFQHPFLRHHQGPPAPAPPPPLIPPPGFQQALPPQSMQSHLKQNLPTPPQKWYAQHQQIGTIDGNNPIRLKTRDNNPPRSINQQGMGGGRGAGAGGSSVNQFVPLQVQKGTGRASGGPNNNNNRPATTATNNTNNVNNNRTTQQQQQHGSPSKKSTPPVHQGGSSSSQQQEGRNSRRNSSGAANNGHQNKNRNGGREWTPSGEGGRGGGGATSSRRMKLKTRIAAKFPAQTDN